MVGARSRRICGADRCPGVSRRIVSGTRIERRSIRVETTPDDHFAAGPNGGVILSRDWRVRQAGRNPSVIIAKRLRTNGGRWRRRRSGRRGRRGCRGWGWGRGGRRSIVFKGPNINRAVDDSRKTGPTLVRGQCVIVLIYCERIAATVKRRTAGEQRIGHRQSAVVGERNETRISHTNLVTVDPIRQASRTAGTD